MRVIKCYHDDPLNSEGLSITMFLSGCSHGCIGCFNPETADHFMPESHEFGASRGVFPTNLLPLLVLHSRAVFAREACV